LCAEEEEESGFLEAIFYQRSDAVRCLHSVYRAVRWLTTADHRAYTPHGGLNVPGLFVNVGWATRCAQLRPCYMYRTVLVYRLLHIAARFCVGWYMMEGAARAKCSQHHRLTARICLCHDHRTAPERRCSANSSCCVCSSHNTMPTWRYRTERLFCVPSCLPWFEHAVRWLRATLFGIHGGFKVLHVPRSTFVTPLPGFTC
jgi:hypothetical protein